MARTRTVKHPKAAKQAEPPAKSVSKADAVRAALADGIESPEDGVAFLKAQYGIEMSKQMWSTYKAQLKARAKKQSGAQPAKRGPKPASPAGDIIDDISAVKGLVAKLGGAQVKKLVDLFE